MYCRHIYGVHLKITVKIKRRTVFGGYGRRQYGIFMAQIGRGGGAFFYYRFPGIDHTVYRNQLCCGAVSPVPVAGLFGSVLFMAVLTGGLVDMVLQDYL